MARPTLIKKELLLFDACCIINLAATDIIDEILLSLPYDCATTDLVASKEILSITSVDGTGTVPIPPSDLRNLEGLSILPLSEDELVAFLQFALDVDDGEASVCALAVSRGCLVATDDRKAIRVLAQTAPSIRVIQTPDLVRLWHEGSGAPVSAVREVVRAIERRARFRPRRDHPLFPWWSSFSSRV